jgi:hypothetical protein
VYALPSLARVHAALNYAPKPTAPADGLGAPRTGIVMSVHLQVRGERLLVAAGFEDGRVEVWACPKDAAPSDGRNERVWERLWSGKCHNEAGE